MRYFIENADYLDNPVIYDENALIDYALETYKECKEDGGYYELLSDYKKKDLMNPDTALNFLNDRFSNDDEPFKEATLY